MTTYKQLIYLVLDELKLNSDDSIYTEDHVMILLNKYRALLLKQRYSNEKKIIPADNYQTLCLDLEQYNSIDGFPCEGVYLRSTKPIPDIISIDVPRVHLSDYFSGEITYVSNNRFRYVGYNKYLQNIIYATKDTNGYLYLRSSNPQYLYLEKVKITGIFADAQLASDLQCSDDVKCDILDRVFPIEDPLVSTLVGLVIKELSNAEYKPEDSDNNASDDLSNLAAFIQRNTKSAIAKSLE